MENIFLHQMKKDIVFYFASMSVENKFLYHMKKNLELYFASISMENKFLYQMKKDLVLYFACLEVEIKFLYRIKKISSVIFCQYLKYVPLPNFKNILSYFAFVSMSIIKFYII